METQIQTRIVLLRKLDQTEEYYAQARKKMTLKKLIVFILTFPLAICSMPCFMIGLIWFFQLKKYLFYCDIQWFDLHYKEPQRFKDPKEHLEIVKDDIDTFLRALKIKKMEDIIDKAHERTESLGRKTIIKYP